MHLYIVFGSETLFKEKCGCCFLLSVLEPRCCLPLESWSLCSFCRVLKGFSFGVLFVQQMHICRVLAFTPCLGKWELYFLSRYCLSLVMHWGGKQGQCWTG